MAVPTSSRYLPIRDAICDLLAAAPALSEVKAIERDAEAFRNLPASMYPALGVFFAEQPGVERAQWVGGRHDHSYRLDVHVAVRSAESARACEDQLFCYVEAVEDALRGSPLLGGLVRNMAVGVVRRWQDRSAPYWQAEAVVAVVCEKRTP